MTVTPESFFAQTAAPESVEDECPRDQWGRPLIYQPDGKKKAYHRASSFGGQIEDTYNLVLWQKRQVARGMAIKPELAKAAPNLDEPDNSRMKRLWNVIVDGAEEAAGSNVKSAIGTAIHAATERVDRGESLDGLPQLLVERANSYWKFCQEEGIKPTSVEVFGVEDEHHVAGTWDRTGWWRRKHKILDVKTSTSMDYAGIVFAVQLAEYAHMSEYNFKTGERTPHEIMDLEEAVIIHVGREQDSHIELYRVDITVGWEYAVLVDQVKKAQREGKHAIRAVEKLDEVEAKMIAATTIDELRAIFARSDGRPSYRVLAATVAAAIKAGA